MVISPNELLMQAFRSRSTDRIINIETEQYAILWGDIQNMFKNAVSVKDGESLVPFMTDEHSIRWVHLASREREREREREAMVQIGFLLCLTIHTLSYTCWKERSSANCTPPGSCARGSRANQQPSQCIKSDQHTFWHKAVGNHYRYHSSDSRCSRPRPFQD